MTDSPPQRTRYDEPYERAEMRLRHATISHPDVRKALLEISKMQLAHVRERVKQPLTARELAPFSSEASAEAGGSIWLAWVALRGVLAYDEIQHYTRVVQYKNEAFTTLIERRVADGTWASSIPLGTSVARYGRSAQGKRKRRGPSAATINAAAGALAECLNAARRRDPENLGQYERKAMSDVLRFIASPEQRAAANTALPRSGPRRSMDAAQKRERRAQPARTKASADERRRLDRAIQAGTVRLVLELSDGGAIYESTS
jgi:hypothetical protein